VFDDIFKYLIEFTTYLQNKYITKQEGYKALGALLHYVYDFGLSASNGTKKIISAKQKCGM
jgi:hypothetical protein